MTTIIHATAALALLAASLPALAASATVTRAWQFKPESSEGLKVRNLIGEVRVERGTTPGIHISATITIDAASQAEAERLAGLIDFRTSDVGAGSRFDVRLPREHFPKIYWEKGASGWWSVSYVEHLGERIRLVRDKGEAPAVRVDLVISAPAGARLDVSNVFGEMEALGFSGTLKLDGAADSLTSTRGEGEVTLDAGSGEVVVNGHHGRVVADTGSGSVKVTDCECELLADTGSGSVTVRGGTGSVSADTGSGRVDVDGFAGSFVADTGSGAVRAHGLSKVERLDVDTGSGGVTVDGDLSALKRLRIDTGSGSVSLGSSAQPSMEIRIDTGSGGVNVDAPGATVHESNDVWTVRTKEGLGHGDIETGSGSVNIDFR